MSEVFALLRNCHAFVCRCLAICLCALLLAPCAYANIITKPMCKAYNNVIDNQFIGVSAMGALTLILLKWKFMDKSEEAMSGLTKTGIATSALLSLPTVIGWFGAQPC